MNDGYIPGNVRTYDYPHGYSPWGWTQYQPQPGDHIMQYGGYSGQLPYTGVSGIDDDLGQIIPTDFNVNLTMDYTNMAYLAGGLILADVVGGGIRKRLGWL